MVDLLQNLDELSVATLVTASLPSRRCSASAGCRSGCPRRPLIVVVVAIVVSSAAELDQHGVATLGVIPSGLPGFDIPPLRPADVVDLVFPALGILFATYAETAFPRPPGRSPASASSTSTPIRSSWRWAWRTWRQDSTEVVPHR